MQKLFFWAFLALTFSHCTSNNIDPDAFAVEAIDFFRNDYELGYILSTQYGAKELFRDTLLEYIEGNYAGSLAKLAIITQTYDQNNSYRFSEGFDCRFIRWIEENAFYKDELEDTYQFEAFVNKFFRIKAVKKESISVDGLIQISKKFFLWRGDDHIISNRDKEWDEIGNAYIHDPYRASYEVDDKKFSDVCRINKNVNLIQMGKLLRNSNTHFLLLDTQMTPFLSASIISVELYEDKYGILQIDAKIEDIYNRYPFIYF